MNRNQPDDWEAIWANPRFSGWDLDDMEAFLPPDDWEDFSQDMTEALDAYRESGSLAIPHSLLKNIRDRLQDQGIEPKAWWAELYGR